MQAARCKGNAEEGRSDQGSLRSHHRIVVVVCAGGAGKLCNRTATETLLLVSGVVREWSAGEWFGAVDVLSSIIPCLYVGQLREKSGLLSAGSAVHDRRPAPAGMSAREGLLAG